MGTTPFKAWFELPLDFRMLEKGNTSILITLALKCEVSIYDIILTLAHSVRTSGFWKKFIIPASIAERCHG